MKNTLLRAVEEAGKIIKSNFGGKFKIESKDIVSNLVTEVDNSSDKKIIEIIKSEYPDHTIISEECGTLDKDSNFKWIIDPIDGTINFAHSIPICCVSIGIEKDKKIIMGAVYNPIDGELFFAEKGKGSFLNDNPIKVTNEKDLDMSLLVTGFPYALSKTSDKPVNVFRSFLKRDIPIRRLGSAALDMCWTACGRFDGFWEFNLNSWDMAGGLIILEEAGAKVSDFKGGEFSVYGKEILATNGLIHDEMIKVIQES
jgi:myo-inositol-1(or 4)-monophosphatase